MTFTIGDRVIIRGAAKRTGIITKTRNLGTHTLHWIELDNGQEVCSDSRNLRPHVKEGEA